MLHAVSLNEQLNWLLSCLRLGLKCDVFGCRGKLNGEAGTAFVAVPAADFAAVLLDNSVAHA